MRRNAMLDLEADDEVCSQVLLRFTPPG